MILDTDTRERDGFTFTIETWHDECAENPREWQDGSPVYFYITSDDRGSTVDVDELSDSVTDSSAGEALRYFIETYSANELHPYIGRAFDLWRALDPAARGHWRLFDGSGYGYSQGHYHDWFALLDTSQLSDGADYAAVVAAEADEYTTWRYGGVTGVTVSLSGEFVDSCGGFYSEESLSGFVGEAIDAHIESLTAQANSHAAGFVGVI